MKIMLISEAGWFKERLGRALSQVGDKHWVFSYPKFGPLDPEDFLEDLEVTELVAIQSPMASDLCWLRQRADVSIVAFWLSAIGDEEASELITAGADATINVDSDPWIAAGQIINAQSLVERPEPQLLQAA